jgi:hypothetical protein
MKTITEIIAPITLLAGSHADTGTTGSGCFMNVVAYLNGEAQITDQSPCVCVTVRPLAIRLNDLLTDAERPRMIPYIERAMGSATDDRDEMLRRLELVVGLANGMRDHAAKHAAEYAAKNAQYAAEYAQYAAEYAAKYAKCAAEFAQYAAEYAAKYAKCAAEFAQYAAECCANFAAECCVEYVALRQECIELLFSFLDAALPKAPAPTGELLARAEKLIEVAHG